MSIPNSVNASYEFKKSIYPFVYYFNNEQIEWNPKKDIADIIKETYNKKDIKVTKYNARDGLFDKPTVEVKSKKELSITKDMRILEHLRSTYIEPVISVKKPIIRHSLSFE